MATINTNVLNTVFESYLTEEINREATLLRLISKRAERKAAVHWSVNVGGTSATGVAITADAPASTYDTVIAAQLPITANSLQTAFTINAKEVEESASMVSAPELRNLLEALLSTAADQMMTTLNQLLYTGTGSVGDAGIIGLNTAVSSLDYAGISATTYPIWKAVEVDCWDTTLGTTDKRKTLTTDLLFEMERKIREKGGRFDLLVTTPKVLEQYKRLFETKRDFTILVADMNNRVPLVDLGFGVGGFGGVPMIDDPYAKRIRAASGNDSAATTALGTNVDDGVIYFLKSGDLELLTVPTAGSSGVNGVYTQMERLGKTGLYMDKFVAGLIPQMVLKSRKNCGILKNIKVS